MTKFMTSSSLNPSFYISVTSNQTHLEVDVYAALSLTTNFRAFDSVDISLADGADVEVIVERVVSLG